MRRSGGAAPPMLIVLPILVLLTDGGGCPHAPFTPPPLFTPLLPSPPSLQMAEGVLKPETWAAIDDPFDKETDDEAAEEFQHM